MTCLAFRSIHLLQLNLAQVLKLPYPELGHKRLRTKREGGRGRESSFLPAIDAARFSQVSLPQAQNFIYKFEQVAKFETLSYVVEVAFSGDHNLVLECYLEIRGFVDFGQSHMHAKFQPQRIRLEQVVKFETLNLDYRD